LYVASMGPAFHRIWSVLFIDRTTASTLAMVSRRVTPGDRVVAVLFVKVPIVVLLRGEARAVVLARVHVGLRPLRHHHVQLRRRHATRA